MKSAGLLIVDAQIGFNPSHELLTGITEIARNYETVVMTRFFNPQGSLYRTVLNWHGDGGELALQIKGSIIIDKTGYGLDAPAIETIKRLHQEWHICGLETDACVLACAFSIWDAGMRPIMLPELCSSPLHAEGMAVARRQFG